MPESDVSEETRRTEMLIDAIRSRIDTQAREMRVPFGYRVLTPERFQAEWRAMTPDQKQAEIQRRGWPEIQRILLGE